MTQWQLPSKKKITGGFVKRHGKKTRYQRGRDYLPAKVGEPKIKRLRVRGGRHKRVALSINTANVYGKGKTKILSVLENSADSQFVRRNIMTKGAIIQTELGKARVTSRPGQTGTINAILIETPKASVSEKK